jgi:hypothetical protein
MRIGQMKRGETISICNKQPQLPPWTAVIGSGYRPDYGTRDKRQEKTRKREIKEEMVKESSQPDLR